VKAILVNIFGGIMKCDVIASGIVKAAKEVSTVTMAFSLCLHPWGFGYLILGTWNGSFKSVKPECLL
jgi:hypothetical protein